MFFVCAIVMLGIMTIFVCFAVIRDRHIVELRQEVSSLRESSIPDDTHQRYEDIERKKIKLGWIRFHPTLRRDEADENRKKGPGPDILSAVFDDNIRWNPVESAWSNLFQGLLDKQYDVIATHTYDIKERRRFVDFTMPILYADIGLFVAADN